MKKYGGETGKSQRSHHSNKSKRHKVDHSGEMITISSENELDNFKSNDIKQTTDGTLVKFLQSQSNSKLYEVHTENNKKKLRLLTEDINKFAEYTNPDDESDDDSSRYDVSGGRKKRRDKSKKFKSKEVEKRDAKAKKENHANKYFN